MQNTINIGHLCFYDTITRFLVPLFAKNSLIENLVNKLTHLVCYAFSSQLWNNRTKRTEYLSSFECKSCEQEEEVIDFENDSGVPDMINKYE